MFCLALKPPHVGWSEASKLVLQGGQHAWKEAEREARDMGLTQSGKEKGQDR